MASTLLSQPTVATLPRAKPKTYRPELDVLRFVAFLAVFFSHGVIVDVSHGTLRNHPSIAHLLVFLHVMGAFGLSLFFLLSSFLITTLLLVEQERTGTLHLRSFYTRRILRIWPLYFTAILGTFAIGYIVSALHLSLGALLAFLLVSTNWFVIAGGFVPLALAPLWSISVEEQFYILWPVLVQRMNRSNVLRFCLMLGIASVLCTWLLARTGSSFAHLWFNSAVEALFFAAGGLLALHSGLQQQVTSLGKTLGGFVMAFFAWSGAVLLIGTRSMDLAMQPLHAVPCFCLIALGAASLLWAALHLPAQFIRRELTYLGRISYGLYVFHGFALFVAQRFLAPHLRGGGWVLGAFLLTIMLASLSYKFLETPFLKLKRRFEFVPSRAV